MKDSYAVRRELLTRLCAAAAVTAFIGSSLKAEAQSHVMHEDSPATHNMLVLGETKIYLSHLPMFDGVTEDKTDYTTPHRYPDYFGGFFPQRGAEPPECLCR